ncbi:MAG TPA: hypothetical protein PKD37_08180 [Oligoflexia bacterium]|nr:hypothetical protein [Oligoflexia bacterium]HMP27941.1 hypothetical protein [Oligoflexia bacterium]
MMSLVKQPEKSQKDKSQILANIPSELRVYVTPTLFAKEEIGLTLGSTTDHNTVSSKSLAEFRKIQTLDYQNVVVYPVLNQRIINDHISDRENIENLIKEKAEKIYRSFLNPLTEQEKKGIIIDLCLCQFLDHNHCRIINNDRSFNIEASSKLLIELAIIALKLGASKIMPSAMIPDLSRQILQTAAEEKMPLQPEIISQCCKFESDLYQAFRGEHARKIKKSYHLPKGNLQDAVNNAIAEIKGGANAVVVKPAAETSEFFSPIKEAIKSINPEAKLIAFSSAGERKISEINDLIKKYLRAGAEQIILSFPPANY